MKKAHVGTHNFNVENLSNKEMKKPGTVAIKTSLYQDWLHDAVSFQMKRLTLVAAYQMYL
jgi:hypothetical protein